MGEALPKKYHEIKLERLYDWLNVLSMCGRITPKCYVYEENGEKIKMHTFWYDEEESRGLGIVDGKDGIRLFYVGDDQSQIFTMV